MHPDLHALFAQPPRPLPDFAEGREVIIYGAGQMGMDSSECLASAGIRIRCAIDRNPAKIGTCIGTIPVRAPESLDSSEKASCLVAIAVVAAPYEGIRAYLESAGYHHICFVGDLINHHVHRSDCAGTCEQALGEAMMAGCVPVVLDNATERHIVEHMETGLVASTLGEYPRLIRLLHDDPALRGRLAANAQNFARQRYDIQATIGMWHRTFGNLVMQPKASRSWFGTPTPPLAPARLYVESLGDHGKPLADYLDAPSAESRQEAGEAIRALFATNSMFSSRNKGSVFQYSSFFPADPMLKEWGQFA